MAGSVIVKLCVLAAWICLSTLLQFAAYLPRFFTGQSFGHVTVEAQEMTSANQAPPAIFITDLARYSDDAVALLMLLRSGAFEIKGIIASAGNVCAKDAAQYTRDIVKLAGIKSLPVIEGPPMSWYEARRLFYVNFEQPSWEKKNAYAGAFASGATCAPESFATTAGYESAASDAADFLIRAARQHAGRLVVILASPATVIAQALKKEPGLAAMLSQVYAMGGSIDVPGNVSPYAEFNAWFDPEAMAELLRSGAPLTVVPLDATNPVTYDPPSMGNLQAGGPGAQYLARYLEFRHANSRKVPMWDEVTAAIAIDPSIVSAEDEHFLTVSTNRDLKYGKVSIIPAATLASQATIRVVTQVDASKVRELLSRLVIEKE